VHHRGTSNALKAYKS